MTTAAALGTYALTRSQPAPPGHRPESAATPEPSPRSSNRGTALNHDAHNVRDYGALGNGVSDDTVAIATAIATVASAGGGVVYFPPGTYLTDTQTLHSKVHYWGAGIEATIIQLRTGADADLFRGAGFTELTGTDATGGIFNWSMRDLTLDGNAAAQRVGSVVRLYGYGYILQNLRIRNGRETGLWSEWSSSAASPGQDSMEAQLANVKVHGCFHGVEWLGPHDSTWVNCTVYSNRGRGIWTRANGDALQVTNTHAWGNGDVSWYLEAQALLLNCQGEGSGGERTNPQVFIGANDCQIIGGSFYGSGSGKVGIAVGDRQHHGIAGLHVDTKILNCPIAAVSLGSDGGLNSITALTWDSGDVPVVGTVAPTTRLRVMTPSNRGPLPAPAVPASGASVTNSCGVDCTIHVAGGMVRSVEVGGAPTGLTSGSFRVPAGQTITLTYTAPPNWRWFGD